MDVFDWIILVLACLTLLVNIELAIVLKKSFWFVTACVLVAGIALVLVFKMPPILREKKDIKIDVMTNNAKRLPYNALNVIDQGNGWVTYDLDGGTFLYHKGEGEKCQGFEAVTQIRR